MEGVILITIFICCSITAIAVNCMLSENKYCNSNYNRANKNKRNVREMYDILSWNK